MLPRAPGQAGGQGVHGACMLAHTVRTNMGQNTTISIYLAAENLLPVIGAEGRVMPIRGKILKIP
jgi:hypothetical protein